MAKRYLTVRERALRVLKNQLESIQPGNGYNTMVGEVRIDRKLPNRPASDKTIQVIVADGVPKYYCNLRRYEDITVEIWFFVQRVENQETEYTLFLSDIRRALICPIPDPTHPQPQKTGIWFKETFNRPLYNAPGDDTVYGMVEYNMQIFYDETDDRLWDGTDVLVEE